MPFNYFCYGAALAEVELDTLTGDFHLLRTDLCMDVGQSLNPAIDIGQACSLLGFPCRVCRYHSCFSCWQADVCNLVAASTGDLSVVQHMHFLVDESFTRHGPLTYVSGHDPCIRMQLAGLHAGGGRLRAGHGLDLPGGAGLGR